MKNYLYIIYTVLYDIFVSNHFFSHNVLLLLIFGFIILWLYIF
jgi:hypothetical protein